MGLKEKAQQYLNIKKEEVYSSLREQSFADPFSFDSKMISLILKDLDSRNNQAQLSLEELKSYERALMDISVLLNNYSKDEIEKIIIYSVIGRVKVKECALFFFSESDGLFLPGKESLNINYGLVHSIKSISGLNAACYFSEDDSLTKDFSEFVRSEQIEIASDEELNDEELKECKITAVMLNDDVEAVIISSGKEDGNVYTEEELGYLAYTSRIIQAYLKNEYLRSEKDRIKKEFKNKRPNVHPYFELLSSVKSKADEIEKDKDKLSLVIAEHSPYNKSKKTKMSFEEELGKIESEVKKELGSRSFAIISPNKYAVLLELNEKRSGIQDTFRHIRNNLDNLEIRGVNFKTSFYEYTRNSYKSIEDFIEDITAVFMGGKIKHKKKASNSSSAAKKKSSTTKKSTTNSSAKKETSPKPVKKTTTKKSTKTSSAKK